MGLLGALQVDAVGAEQVVQTAGVGQALLQAELTGDADLPYYLARNEQAMVQHGLPGFAVTAAAIGVVTPFNVP